MEEAVRKKEVKVHIFIGNIVMNEHFFLKKALFFLKRYNNNFPLLFPRKQTYFVCWAYEHMALGRPFLFLLQFLGLTG